MSDLSKAVERLKSGDLQGALTALGINILEVWEADNCYSLKQAKVKDLVALFNAIHQIEKSKPKEEQDTAGEELLSRLKLLKGGRDD
jgi:hypothetical protein